MCSERTVAMPQVIEVHPEFKFDEENDTGFLPFKFRLKTPLTY
jgi:hypothetical protein